MQFFPQEKPESFRRNKLTYLECEGNYDLKKLAVSNNSVLRTVLSGETELDVKSMKYLSETLKRNRDYNDVKKDGRLRIEFVIQSPRNGL